MGKLEALYPDRVVVIGVHSPKYTAERDPAGVRAAVERNGIRHPVVNDPDMAVWDSYAVSAWPTLVFISPEGYVIGRHAGEATTEALASAIDRLIEELTPTGVLTDDRLDLHVSLPTRPLSSLAFPGKVLAWEDHLFVADSGHNRVVLADRQGHVSSVAGSGEAGLEDGPFETARFSFPKGMALEAGSSTLYVADANNHAVRALDLRERTVRTVAGTGEQLRRIVRSGPARDTALSSPWDLLLFRGTLYIAMAGTHQVWVYDSRAGTVGVWAGTGHEGIRDGSPESAWLAQPMGIAAWYESVFVACAETQAVREIDLRRDAVTTIVGRGLFEWGYEDGPAPEARLQHPQGIAAIGHWLYVADTYNNVIRVIERGGRTVSTLSGTGTPGMEDGECEGSSFNQPSGVAIWNRTLYVADTNNHAIRAVNLDGGHVETLPLSGL